jgi:hypothetical protein
MKSAYLLFLPCLCCVEISLYNLVQVNGFFFAFARVADYNVAVHAAVFIQLNGCSVFEMKYNINASKCNVLLELFFEFLVL